LDSIIQYQNMASESSNLSSDGWYHEKNSEFWPGQAMSLKVDKVLYHEKSPYQDILVFKSTNWGNVLVLDNAIQVTERDEFAYQEMISHVPLFSHPNPKKVCIIGGGDGGVLREVARHPSVEEIHMCEIDKLVIEASKKYLPGLSSAFDDKRLKLQVMDGAEFLTQHKNTFDVIITDSSDPIGPAETLFRESFYQTAYEALTPDGILCTQAESIWLHLDFLANMTPWIKKIFGKLEYANITIPTYPCGGIGFWVCGKHPSRSCKSPVRKPDAKTQEVLKYYSPEVHEASFVLPAFAARKLNV